MNTPGLSSIWYLFDILDNIVIRDISDKVVLSVENISELNKHKIDLSALADGIYLVELEVGGNKVVRKIIK